MADEKDKFGAPNTDISKLVHTFNIDNPLPNIEIKKKLQDYRTEYVDQVRRWIELHKTEIILAWSATYGFEPNKAEIVHEMTDTGTNIYMRERISN